MPDPGSAPLRDRQAADQLILRAATKRLLRDFRCECRKHGADPSDANLIRWLIRRGNIPLHETRRVAVRQLFEERYDPTRDMRSEIMIGLEKELGVNLRTIQRGVNGPEKSSINLPFSEK